MGIGATEYKYKAATPNFKPEKPQIVQNSNSFVVAKQNLQWATIQTDKLKSQKRMVSPQTWSRSLSGKRTHLTSGRKQSSVVKHLR